MPADGRNRMTLLTILYFIIGLSVLIFIHELGHFIAAKIFGVYVYEFSLFMGPKLFQFKIGETKYTLRCLPIGGYCSMAGEQDSQAERNENEIKQENEIIDIEDNQEIVEKKKKKVEEPLPDVPFERTLLGIKNWKKLIIMAAGAFLNIVLCYVLMVAYFCTIPTSKINVKENSFFYNNELRSGEEIRKMYVEFYEGDTYDKDDKEELHLTVYLEDISTYRNIDIVYDGGYDYLYDRIKEKYPEFSGFPTELTQRFRFEMADGKTYSATRDYHVVINEDKTAVDPTSYPKLSELGISSANAKLPFFQALGRAGATEGEMATLIYKSLGSLFTKEGISNVAGPVGMYSIAKTYMEEGFMYFVYFLAMISVNLGIMNLLPFPALDGGKIVITVCEMITRKKMPAKIEGVLNLIGFALLIGLMLVVTFKDVFFPSF